MTTKTRRIKAEVVAAQLNDWYSLIRKNHIKEAEKIKNKIESKLDMMEENQNVLLYYSLLDFRHQIMLSYVNPKIAININNSLATMEKRKEKIEKSQLDGMIEYYFWFFKGMYEFKRKNFITAINYYKIAEKKVDAVDDEVEKAEFYYKLAEFYYHINQNYLSMNYANQALETFKTHETLIEKKIFCDFIIAGNWVETMQYDAALKSLLHALNDANKTENQHLKAAALFNLGNCYFYQNKLSKASYYMKSALSIFKQHSSYVPKVLFNLMYVRIKQKNYEEAEKYYKQGIKSAKALNDKEFAVRLHILKEIYLSSGNNQSSVKKAFECLEAKKLYLAVEELALDAARYYKSIGQLESAIYYYEKGIAARNKIKQGDMLSEI